MKNENRSSNNSWEDQGDSVIAHKGKEHTYLLSKVVPNLGRRSKDRIPPFSDQIPLGLRSKHCFVLFRDPYILNELIYLLLLRLLVSLQPLEFEVVVKREHVYNELSCESIPEVKDFIDDDLGKSDPI